MNSFSKTAHLLGMDPKRLSTRAQWVETVVQLQEPVEDPHYPVYIVEGAPSAERATVAVDALNPNVEVVMVQPTYRLPGEFRVLTRLWK